MKRKSGFNWRSFISFGLFISFFFIFISGLILYVAPPGRVAHWNNWILIGFGKDSWQAIHTIFSYAFAAFAFFHIFSMNWRSIWSYIKLRSQNQLNKKKEFWASVILSLLIFLGTAANIPPFESVMTLGETLKNSWEDKENMPPVPHTELYTLAGLSEQFLHVPADQLQDKLQKAGLKVNEGQTLAEIGENNQMSPARVFEIITRGDDVTVDKSTTFQPGQGLGQRTLAEYAAFARVSPEKLLQILSQNGIKASADQTFKEIGEDNEKAAHEIFALIKQDQ
ncbi:MAG: DUF4405 domain-containing protein [Candidatus Cyclobacteriaceae bacterium M3_2C_046]